MKQDKLSWGGYSAFGFLGLTAAHVRERVPVSVPPVTPSLDIDDVVVCKTGLFPLRRTPACGNVDPNLESSSYPLSLCYVHLFKWFVWLLLVFRRVHALIIIVASLKTKSVLNVNSL